jgi:hypothetical protein
MRRRAHKHASSAAPQASAAAIARAARASRNCDPNPAYRRGFAGREHVVSGHCGERYSGAPRPRQTRPEALSGVRPRIYAHLYSDSMPARRAPVTPIPGAPQIMSFSNRHTVGTMPCETIYTIACRKLRALCPEMIVRLSTSGEDVILRKPGRIVDKQGAEPLAFHALTSSSVSIGAQAKAVWAKVSPPTSVVPRAMHLPPMRW